MSLSTMVRPYTVSQYMVSTIIVRWSLVLLSKKETIRTDKCVHTHTVQMKSGMLYTKNGDI